MNDEPKIFALMETLVRGMVFYPDELQITDTNGVITIIPHTADYRLLCGKGGRQIRALKFLVNRMAALAGIKKDLVLEESFEGHERPKQPFKRNDKFDIQACVDLVQQFCAALFAVPVPVTHEKTDRLRVFIDANGKIEIPTVFAMSDAFYTYGYRQGCIVSVKLLKHEAGQ